MAASHTNAAKKMVMKTCYRSQTEKPRKGKGAYTRKAKHAKAGRAGLCVLGFAGISPFAFARFLCLRAVAGFHHHLFRSIGMRCSHSRLSFLYIRYIRSKHNISNQRAINGRHSAVRSARRVWSHSADSFRKRPMSWH